MPIPVYKMIWLILLLFPFTNLLYSHHPYYDSQTFSTPTIPIPKTTPPTIPIPAYKASPMSASLCLFQCDYDTQKDNKVALVPL